MAPHVTPMAQRHHGQETLRAVVMQVVKLRPLAPAVGAALRPPEHAHGSQRLRRAPHEHLARIALPPAPRYGAHPLAVGPLPASARLAMRLLVLRVVLPAGRAALLCVRRAAFFAMGLVPLARPRANRLAMLLAIRAVAGAAVFQVPPAVLPVMRAQARLAPGHALADLEVEVELHQVLRLATLRARLRYRMIRIAGPIHRQSSSHTSRIDGNRLPFTLTTGTPPSNMRGKSGNPRFFFLGGRWEPQMNTDKHRWDKDIQPDEPRNDTKGTKQEKTGHERHETREEGDQGSRPAPISSPCSAGGRAIFEARPRSLLFLCVLATLREDSTPVPIQRSPVPLCQNRRCNKSSRPRGRSFCTSARRHLFIHAIHNSRRCFLTPAFPLCSIVPG